MSLRVYRRHLRKANRCGSGCRVWFARQNPPWSWGDFLRNGLPIEDFDNTGDPLAIEIADIVRAEAAEIVSRSEVAGG